MKFLLFFFLLTFSSFTANETAGLNDDNSDNNADSEAAIAELYYSIEGSMPEMDIFLECIRGYHQLSDQLNVEKQIITVIDYRISSNKKRLWVIDLDNNEVLFHTLVAHGKSSGNVFASSFSNISGSHQSSLGFYITGTTYTGKHGNSLYLNGIEEGINDNAKDRYIVMHGAEYVSYEFIRKNGRLGRSFGCPSLPVDIAQEIIRTIKNGTCLFQYFPDQKYISSSKLIGQNT